MAGSTQTTVLSAALAQCWLLQQQPGLVMSQVPSPLLVQLLAPTVASARFVLRLLRASFVQAGKVHPCCYCLRAQPTAGQNHLGYTSTGFSQSWAAHMLLWWRHKSVPLSCRLTVQYWIGRFPRWRAWHKEAALCRPWPEPGDSFLEARVQDLLHFCMGCLQGW